MKLLRAFCKTQLLILHKLQPGVRGTTRKAVNLFNGLDRDTGVFRKPLKRFQDFNRALIPRLKPGGNEKLNVAKRYYV